MKALAVTSAAPTALFPGLPTMAASLPGYEALAIYGLFAPVGTPPAIIRRVNSAVVRFLQRADIKEEFANAGMGAAGSTLEDLATSVKAEVARIGKVIKDAGIRGNQEVVTICKSV